jgi:RNA polymerase sigma factor (TIGR02999 family)
MGDVTLLLKQWTTGDKEALTALMSLLYDELRRRASIYLSKERINHTLRPTELVNESFIRLVNQQQVDWQSRAHFFGVASQIMRHILVDYARTHGATKRGGESYTIALEDNTDTKETPEINLVALDDALTQLEKMNPVHSQIVELRFFGGLSIEETASVLKISPRSVTRGWVLAKAWLYQEVKRK